MLKKLLSGLFVFLILTGCSMPTGYDGEQTKKEEVKNETTA